MTKCRSCGEGQSDELREQQPGEKLVAPLKRVAFIVSGRTLEKLYQSIIGYKAHRLGITGTIENREDGTVRIVAEGDEGSIQKFQEALWVKKPPVLVEEVRKEREEEVKERAREFTPIHVKTEEEERYKEYLYEEEQERRNTVIEDWMRADDEIGDAIVQMLEKSDPLGEFTIGYPHPISKVYEDIIKEVERIVPELHEVPWLIEQRDKTKAHLNELELRLLSIYPKVAKVVKDLSRSSSSGVG